MEILCVPVGPLQANCYLVWDESSAACAVDPGGEPERLARLVEKKGLRLEAILVTHGHFDHVEGVKGLAEATGARVYCSAQVQPVLSGSQGCSATGYPVPALGEPCHRGRGRRRPKSMVGEYHGDGHRHSRAHPGRRDV